MSDHDLYAIAEAHLRTIRDIERDLAAERERVKRLRRLLRAREARHVWVGNCPDDIRIDLAMAEADCRNHGDLDDREARS